MFSMIRLITLSAVISLFASLALAQDADEIRFVKSFFDKLQPTSFAQGREYCGYFGFDRNDNFIATKPTRGGRDGCLAAEPPEDMDIFASYHTHGSYDPDADSEVPSDVDMRADADENIDGYIATPGGRIWFIATENRPIRATMICGLNCTVSDSKFKRGDFPQIRKSYTLPQIRMRDNF
jgi:uncharacterized protein DUF4329